MNTSISVYCIGEEGYQLKLQGADWELNIHMTKDEFHSIRHLSSANWETRSSIKAGCSAIASVFWSYNEEKKLVSILVGCDDEAWDLAVTVPIDDFTKSVSKYL